MYLKEPGFPGSEASRKEELINRAEHLTIEGLHKIVAIKASMNNGLSASLKEAFPGIIPVPRPVVVDQEIKDPKPLAGFTGGEGCFLVVFQNSSSCKLGVRVQLKFSISQHSRDQELMNSIVEYFGCGKYYPNSKKEHLNVTGLNKIVGLKASMNRGLSPELKAAFPEVTPEKRLIINEQIKDPY